MQHYLRIYKALLALNFHILLAYRANFINSIISTLAWAIFSVVSMLLLTSRTSSVFGWSRDELLVLTGCYSIIIGTFHMVFSRNFDRFSEIIHLGQLDSILVKPADGQFLVTFWRFNYTSLARIILGIWFTTYMLEKIHIPITLAMIGGFSLFLVLGIVFLYSFWFLIVTLTIWSTRLSNLVELLFTITGIARYPEEIVYGIRSYLFLFLLPIFLVVSLPTKILLTRPLGEDIVILILFSLGLFFLSRGFWKFALRHYASASS